MCDFRGRSILVGLKKKKKKKIPTDPNFEDHAIGNTHIFFLALTLICAVKIYYELTTHKKLLKLTCIEIAV